MSETAIRHSLDHGPTSTFQRSVVTLAALAIVFDGFDNQALGLSIASVAKDWSVPPSAFGSVAAAGLIGMTGGTWIAGALGDRIGRRWALIGSVLTFGIFTLLTAFSDGLGFLMAMRFLAGLGLGGAMPNATAVAAEFTPLKSRPVAVTLTIVCVPLGGLLGGMVAAELLPNFGWRALFAVGGVAPILLGLAMLVWLPESPSYLARIPSRRGDLQKVMHRLGHSLEGQRISSADNAAVAAEKSTFGALFTTDLRIDTAGLWIAFFLCLIAVYTVFNWVPATLSTSGFDARTSSLGLAGFNLGGVAGAILAAAVITRWGSRRVMLPLSAMGAVVAGVLWLVGVSHFSGPAIIGFLSVLGFSVNGVQTTMFALAAHVYPSHVRATGVGAALGFGRGGAILSTFLGAQIAAAGAASGIFMVLSLAMAGALVGLAIVRNHVPSASQSPAGNTAGVR